MFSEWKKPAVISVRIIELFCIGLTLTGFLWAASDWLLLYVLVSAPVTPLSLLCMLYGLVGACVSEALARLINRSVENGGSGPK